MTTIVEVPPPVNAGDPNTWAALAEAALWNAELLAELGYADLNDPEATAVTMAAPATRRLRVAFARPCAGFRGFDFAVSGRARGLERSQ